MTPRSLVGMTMGARRRRLWDEFFDEAWDGATISNFRTEAAKYRLGQRLRPCPGCQKCGSSVRRFAPTAGWKSPRKWVIWDGSQLWMIARTWRRKCAIPNLSDYLAAVEDGTWKELFCDGSGVLPAKGKVRR